MAVDAHSALVPPCSTQEPALRLERGCAGLCALLILLGCEPGRVLFTAAAQSSDGDEVWADAGDARAGDYAVGDVSVPDGGEPGGDAPGDATPPATLQISVVGQPGSGPGPINDIDLVVTKQDGNQSDDISCQYDCDPNNGLNFLGGAAGPSPLTLTTACDYTSVGTHLATVRCAQGAASDVLATAQVYVSFASSGTIAATLVASRTTGTFPLAAQFDARSTDCDGDGAMGEWIDDLMLCRFEWSFGDANVGNWSQGAQTVAGGAGPSRNSDTGFLTAHVFESGACSPTCNATLTVTDPLGNSGIATVEITPESPEVSYAGANTVCVGQNAVPTAGADGCPAGATVLQSADFDAMVSGHIGSNMRVLFKAGESFIQDSNIIVDSSTTNCTIGSFGNATGGQASVTVTTTSGTAATLTIEGTDCRVLDLKLTSNPSTTPRQWLGGNGEQLTVVGNTIDGFYRALSSPALDASTHPAHTTWVSNTTTQAASANVIDYWLLRDNLTLLGNNIQSDDDNGLHALLLQYAPSAVIAHNNINSSGDVAIGSLCTAATGKSCSSSCLDPDGCASTNIVLRDNHFASPNAARLLSLAPIDSNRDERVGRVLVEGNYFNLEGPTSRGIEIDITDTEIRNNIFCRHNSTTGATLAIVVNHTGTTNPHPARVRVINNAAFVSVDLAGTASIHRFVSIESGDNHAAFNNILWQEGDDAVLVFTDTTSALSGTNFDNNTVAVYPFAANPAIAIAEFCPVSGMTASGTHTSIGYDLFGLARDGSYTVGPLEPDTSRCP